MMRARIRSVKNSEPIPLPSATARTMSDTSAHRRGCAKAQDLFGARSDAMNFPRCLFGVYHVGSEFAGLGLIQEFRVFGCGFDAGNQVRAIVHVTEDAKAGIERVFRTRIGRGGRCLLCSAFARPLYLEGVTQQRDEVMPGAELCLEVSHDQGDVGSRRGAPRSSEGSQILDEHAQASVMRPQQVLHQDRSSPSQQL